MTPTDGLIGLAFLLGFIVLWALKIVWEQNWEIKQMNNERFEAHEFYKNEILKIWGVLDNLDLSDRLKELGQEAADEFIAELESIEESVGSPPSSRRLSLKNLKDGKVSRPGSG